MLVTTSFPEKPYFVGLFKDGKSVLNHDLTDLAQIPDIIYFVKVVYTAYNLRKYTLVNRDGSINLFRLGDLELRDIGGEGYAPNLAEHLALITFYDHSNNVLRQERIKTGQCAEVMLGELLKLFKGLNESMR
ncbi:MAG: hypothetical protein JST32_08160 [Bacteroidetes bacterium]|nr:hypothetical protein [Bacteroidota bacterium]